MPYASNATLLSRVGDGELEGLAVYKPRRGESPLWDLPSGTLCLREQAAWLVDVALGWGIVPPAVLREGPAGYGFLQLYVDVDPEMDVRSLLQTHADELRRLATFDIVVNNADRKAGHLLVDSDGRLWGVDHGICFHEEPKLRTVVWAFAEDPIADDLLADLATFREGLHGETGSALSPLLSPDEITAMDVRIATLLETRRYPAPGSGRHVPWPPW